MRTIAQLEDEIREIINSPRKQHALLQNHATWYMLCSCLDTIGDTELCLDAFLGKDADRSDYGSKYLYVYGVLQALFVQQDAIQNLTQALQISYNPDPLLVQIREIRNDSIGHPTKRGGGTGRAFNFISRVTLGPHGFDLMTAYPDGSTSHFKHVNIPDLIAEQRDVLVKVLDDVIKTLRSEEMEHRRKFVDEKLADAFPPTLHYHFGKIFEGIHRPEYAELGGVNVKFILQCVEQFKTGLQKREILEAYDSVTYTLELLDYPLQELRAYFHNSSQSHLNEKDAYIFAYFARKQMDELLELAKELDDEYGKPA